MVTITLNGLDYALATNLRVAYNVQNQHNHKSYMAIFSEIGEMCLEEQIDILYAAFAVGNPDDSKTFTREMFRKYILDSNEFSASVIMDLLKGVISGILGTDLDAAESEQSEKATDEAKNV